MLVLNAPVIFVPSFFQNLTFLNINISSHQYEYPDSIFLKVSNESRDSLFLPVYESMLQLWFGSFLYCLYFVVSVCYI